MAANMTATVATQSALDAITNVDETPTKLPASDQVTEPEGQFRMPESMHIDESNVEARSKPRTLAIVAALYMVQFIAALDQTIIA